MLRVRNGNLIFRLYFPLSACAHRGKLGRGILQKQIDAKQRHCLPSPSSACFSIRNPRLSSEECAPRGFSPPSCLGGNYCSSRGSCCPGRRGGEGQERVVFNKGEREREVCRKQIYGNDIGVKGRGLVVNVGSVE